ncbi:MAG TPA: acyl-CoA reductase, partial [Armatimonadota bacterium]|nr:acyl-CoA reductase [Armatimonadota bacterium]
MNLVDGRILESDACDSVLDELEERVFRTLSKGRLDPERVIGACDRALVNLKEEEFLKEAAFHGIAEPLGRSYLSEARHMFCGGALHRRLRAELGEDFGKPHSYTPLFRENTVTEEIRPLGVLLHIAAGNMDGLPAFSVLEGLLAGNVNILKLPAAEGGVSARL